MRAKPIIVAQNKLGAVNHLRLTLEALPKGLRAQALVVLMSPPKPDIATRTNARLLAEFFMRQQTFTLPWFGERFSPPAALKLPPVRRALQQLTG